MGKEHSALPNFALSSTHAAAGSPDPVVMTLAPSAGPADVGPACAALRSRLAEGKTRLVVCDVAALTRSDLGTVELICRLASTARACGCRLALRGVPWHLRSLLLFAGLDDVLPCVEDEPPGSVLEAER
jgi:ABC-type transporter Mla MlaB component